MFIDLLTAASVFVHAMVGCCAHADHGVIGGCCEPTAAVSEAVEDCCPTGHGHSSVGHLLVAANAFHAIPSQQPERHAPHQCRHADCKGSLSEIRKSDGSVRLLSVGALLADRCVGGGAIAVEQQGPSLLGPYASAHKMPLRAHLAKSVLLL